MNTISGPSNQHQIVYIKWASFRKIKTPKVQNPAIFIFSFFSYLRIATKVTTNSLHLKRKRITTIANT